MHLFYVSHDYMGTWTLTLPSTKTGSMMPKSRKMCSGTHRVHSHLRESWNQTKLEEVSSLNIHIRETSGCEPLSVAFSCMILVVPGLHDFIGQVWDLPTIWWSLDMPSAELQKLVQKINLSSCVFIMLQRILKGSQCSWSYDFKLKQK